MSGPAHSAPAPYGPNVWDVPLPKPADEMKVFHGVLSDFKEGSKRCASSLLLSVLAVDLTLLGGMECRAAHIVYAKVAFERGWIISGGAIFRDENSTDMVGSWILLRAESLKQAREMLEADVYTTGGAWDPSQFELRPIAIAPLAAQEDGGSFAAYLESAAK
ncbi:hypothetical protein JCM8208_002782 [Rhodotorula glutinis]